MATDTGEGTKGRREDEQRQRSSRLSSAQANEDRIDLGQLGIAIYDGWRIIIGVALAIFGAVMLKTMTAPMTFDSEASLYLGELGSPSLTAGESGLEGGGGANSDMASEMEILRSRSLFERAAVASGLNVEVGPSGWRAPRFWQWLLAGRDVDLLDQGVRQLRVTNVELTKAPREGRSYTLTVGANSDYRVTADGELIGEGRFGAPWEHDGMRMLVNRGEEGVPAPGSEFALRVLPIEDVVDARMHDLTVGTPTAVTRDQLRVLALSFQHESPRLAANLLRALMQSYLQERQSWKTEDASAAQEFVSSQLQSIKGELEAIEQKLASYRSNTRGVTLDSEAASMIAQIGDVEQQRVAARLEVASLQDMARALGDPRAGSGSFMLGDVSDPVLTELSTTLTTSRRTLADLSTRFMPGAYEVRTAQAQVDTQVEMMRDYLGKRLARAQEHLRALTGVVNQFEGKLKSMPGAELGVAQLTRESEVYRRTYQFLLERQQQAGIVRASTVSKNRVLDQARVPAHESGPQLTMRAMSGLVGLLLGIVVVLARHFLSSKIQGENELRIATFEAPILGRLPRVPLGDTGKDLEAVRLLRLTIGDSRSAFAEAMRSLRTKLYLASTQDMGSVVLVTSPAPGDGKTATTLSLAAMLAADKKHVLVIDADLRKPSHHELFRHDNALGLRGVMSGEHSWRSAVRPIDVRGSELYVLGTGQGDIVDLSSPDAIGRLLMEARSRFDFVLIDCASYPIVVDALILARLADFVLSVVRLGHSPSGQTREHARALMEVSHAYGVVVNGVSPLPVYGRDPFANNGGAGSSGSSGWGELVSFSEKLMGRRRRNGKAGPARKSS